MKSISTPRGLSSRPFRVAAAILAVVIGIMASMLSAVIVAVPAGAAESANIDQCGNGPIGTPNNCALSTQWENGNLGASKAHYAEGDSVPYRLIMGGLTPNAVNTISFAWDTTKGGMHAFDYVTSFDRTVVGANPCAGVVGCGAATTFPIPGDPNVAGAGVTQIAGNFTMFGGTITNASAYTLTGTYAGDSTTSITLTFTSPTATAVLAWGGHISTRQDWGMNNSAVSISGSPYHMRLGALNGSGGNQDRSLSADAVIFPASITIIKDAVPNDPQDFSFTATGGLATPFVLDDDPASVTPTNTQAFTGITTFTTYTVTEAAAAGWTQSFPNPACTVTSANGGTQGAANATVTIDLKEGENVTCTFTNTRQTGTLEIKKILSPTTDDGLFNLLRDGQTVLANATHNSTTGPVVVTTGQHSVAESAVAGTDLGDYTSTINCGSGDVAGPGPVNVNVGNGQAVLCTITNTRHTGRINVTKVLDPASDGGTFDLQINNATVASGVSNGGTGFSVLQPGTYSVGELAAGSTDLGDYTSSIQCDNGPVVPGPTTSVTLASDQIINCVITNVRHAGTITVTKVLSPSTDAGRFDLLINGTVQKSAAGNNESTPAVPLQPGVYAVSELAAGGANLADYTSSISCSDGTNALNATTVNVTLASDQNIVCTITNVRHTGTINVTKALDPTTDDGRFDLLVDGNVVKAAAGHGEGGSATNLQPGTYTVAELAAGGADLGDYTSSIVCDNGAPVNGTSTSVNLASDQTINCVITNVRHTGGISVTKVLDPTTDDGRFDLQVDGNTVKAAAGNGEGGTAINLQPGVYTVGELAAAGTDLADYTSSIVCDNGAPVPGPITAVTLASDQTINCVITNVRHTGTITVTKVLSPSTDAGRFDLLIDGIVQKTAAGNNESTPAVALQPGVYAVAELAAAGSPPLTAYDSSISCNDGTNVVGVTTVNVTLGSDDNIACTITNVRHTGTINVTKALDPTTDDGRFDLLVDGSIVKASAGNGDSGSATDLQPGDYTVAELAAAGTSLADYSSTIVCDNGAPVNGPSTSVTLASDQTINCVITNVRLTGTITLTKVLSPANDPGLFNLQIDGATAGTGADVGNGGTTGAIVLPTGNHTVSEIAGTNTVLSDYNSTIVCGNAAPVNGTSTVVSLTSGQNVSCTATNIRKVVCPDDNDRVAASRGTKDDDPCYGHDPGDTDPGDPYGNDPGTTKVDDPYVPPTIADPGAEVAGDTNQAQPAPEQVLGGEVERPAPDQGLIGLLPRTGAGIMGEAMLALLLIGGGLVLRQARRRRSSEA